MSTEGQRPASGLQPQPGAALLALYDTALPLVHGYLLSRCGDRATRALAAVRAGGGTAQEPEAKPYGRLVECTDPAGLRFQLWEG